MTSNESPHPLIPREAARRAVLLPQLPPSTGSGKKMRKGRFAPFPGNASEGSHRISFKKRLKYRTKRLKPNLTPFKGLFFPPNRASCVLFCIPDLASFRIKFQAFRSARKSYIYIYIFTLLCLTNHSTA